MGTFWIWLTLWAVASAAICVAIGQRKSLDTTESAFWGFFLGVIGIIIVLCQSPKLPAAPAGMAAIKCPRCNAVQNVSYGQRDYECWQCHQANPVTVAIQPLRKASTGPTRGVRCPTCQVPKKIAVDAATFWCPYCDKDVTAPVTNP